MDIHKIHSALKKKLYIPLYVLESDYSKIRPDWKNNRRQTYSCPINLFIHSISEHFTRNTHNIYSFKFENKL